MAAGGIDHHRGQSTFGELLQLFQFRSIALGKNGVTDSHPLFAELEPLWIQIQNDGTGAGQSYKFDHSQTDRPGANHLCVFSRLRSGSIHGMAANRQRFHQGQLFQGQFG